MKQIESCDIKILPFLPKVFCQENGMNYYYSRHLVLSSIPLSLEGICDEE